jgi:uncharacterized membrane protein YoaK (UPF0700 family)
MVIMQMVFMFLLPVIFLVSLVAFVWFLYTKNKTASIKAFLILIICLIALLGIGRTEFWEIDSCLDSGGRYNYELKLCEH